MLAASTGRSHNRILIELIPSPSPKPTPLLQHPPQHSLAGPSKTPGVAMGR